MRYPDHVSQVDLAFTFSTVPKETECSISTAPKPGPDESRFPQMHSTETALLRMTSDIMMSSDGGEHCLVLCDLNSACDTFHT